jgi:hypothetical protein
MHKRTKVKNHVKMSGKGRGVMRRTKRSLMIYNSICLKKGAPTDKIENRR